MISYWFNSTLICLIYLIVIHFVPIFISFVLNSDLYIVQILYLSIHKTSEKKANNIWEKKRTMQTCMMQREKSSWDCDVQQKYVMHSETKRDFHTLIELVTFVWRFSLFRCSAKTITNSVFFLLPFTCIVVPKYGNLNHPWMYIKYHFITALQCI